MPRTLVIFHRAGLRIQVLLRVHGSGECELAAGEGGFVDTGCHRRLIMPGPSLVDTECLDHRNRVRFVLGFAYWA